MDAHHLPYLCPHCGTAVLVAAANTTAAAAAGMPRVDVQCPCCGNAFGVPTLDGRQGGQGAAAAVGAGTTTQGGQAAAAGGTQAAAAGGVYAFPATPTGVPNQPASHPIAGSGYAQRPPPPPGYQ